MHGVMKKQKRVWLWGRSGEDQKKATDMGQKGGFRQGGKDPKERIKPSNIIVLRQKKKSNEL